MDTSWALGVLRQQLVRNKEALPNLLCVCTWCCCCCFSVPPLEQVRLAQPWRALALTPRGLSRWELCSPPGTTWPWGHKRSCCLTSLQEQNSRNKSALHKSNLLSFNLIECKKTVSIGGSELLPLPLQQTLLSCTSLQGGTGQQGRYRADPESFQVWLSCYSPPLGPLILDFFWFFLNKGIYFWNIFYLSKNAQLQKITFWNTFLYKH